MRGLKTEYLKRLGGCSGFIEPPFVLILGFNKTPLFKGWRTLFAALPHGKKSNLGIYFPIFVE